MDGRESMALSGSSSSYYLHRGVGGSGSASGSHAPPSVRPNTNPNISVQSSGRDGSVGPTFPFQSTSPSFPHGLSVAMVPSAGGEPAKKKKRGRPRKYGPDGTNVSLGLSPMSATPPAGEITPTPKRSRGRPPGSGWKQQLAPLGEWMNSSAGLAFTPHIINIAAGEDIASKILSFSQQRPRAVCILSANGAVSSVTLRQPTSSGNTMRFEGHFQILCLSGSYLVAESGGPHNRTGGLSVSLCSHDGHVIGGGVGGMLIAASPVQVLCQTLLGHMAIVASARGTLIKGEAPNALLEISRIEGPFPLQPSLVVVVVAATCMLYIFLSFQRMHDKYQSMAQVVVCSFVYGGSKLKEKAVDGPRSKQNSAAKPSENSPPPPTATSSRKISLHSSPGFWPGSRQDTRNPHTEIDLTRG